MSASTDVREQLQALRIAKDQRPAGQRARRGWVRWMFGLLVLAAVAAGLYAERDRIVAAFGASTAEASDVRLMTITRRTEPDPAPVLMATGKIVSDHRVEVSTKVSGQIVELRFEQGQKVQQGQVLAHIEDVAYRARRDEAAALLERARANLEYQKTNFARVDRLHREGSSAEIEFADAKRALQEGQAQVDAAEAGLAFAEKQWRDCEVVAPITGVILERNVEVGDFVAAEGGRGAMANAQFGAIADMTALRVEVDVSELDIARLRRGMPCLITPDAHKDHKYNGHVMWIDPGANYSKATVGVKVRIENPDDSLRVEGSAQVAFLSQPPRVATTQEAQSLWVPATAVRRNADGSATAFVALDGHLRVASVRVGRESGDQIEIVDGLREGDRIAIAGLDKLRDGQRFASQ